MHQPRLPGRMCFVMLALFCSLAILAGPQTTFGDGSGANPPMETSDTLFASSAADSSMPSWWHFLWLSVTTMF